MPAKTPITSELDAALTVFREHGITPRNVDISFTTSENGRVSETRLEIELDDEPDVVHGRTH